jgi:hypothetical protein
MSIFNYEEGKQIAIIKKKKTDEKEQKGKKVFMNQPETNIRQSYDKIDAKDNEYIQLSADPESERICLYIVGASGSGKSYYATQFIKEWKKTNKTKKIYLISPITDDKNINSLKPTRLNPQSQAFLQEPPTCEDFANSLLICDDIEAYDKPITQRIMTLINSILTTGRHHKVSLLFLAHNPTQGNMTKILLLESHGIVVYPKTMGGKSSKYLLDQYLGLDKNQIKKLKNMNSRAVCILRSYPLTLISENEIVSLNEF